MPPTRWSNSHQTQMITTKTFECYNIMLSVMLLLRVTQLVQLRLRSGIIDPVLRVGWLLLNDKTGARRFSWSMIKRHVPSDRVSFLIASQLDSDSPHPPAQIRIVPDKQLRAKSNIKIKVSYVVPDNGQPVARAFSPRESSHREPAHC
jgi:hypothetical protein